VFPDAVVSSIAVYLVTGCSFSILYGNKPPYYLETTNTLGVIGLLGQQQQQQQLLEFNYQPQQDWPHTSPAATITATAAAIKSSTVLFAANILSTPHPQPQQRWPCTPRQQQQQLQQQQ